MIGLSIGTGVGGTQPLRRGDEWIALIIIAMGLILRLARLDFQSLWFDEVYSVFVSAGGARLLLERVQADVHPPLYYFLLGLWLSLFQLSDWHVRMVSAISGCLSLPLFWLIARKLVPGRTALFALLLFSLSLFQVWFAQEARAYILAELFALTGTYFFLMILERRDPALAFAGYALSTALLVYTDYSACLLPGAHGIIVAGLVIGKRLPLGTLRVWSCSALFAFLLFLPWMRIALHQFFAVKSGFWTPEPSLSELAALPIRFANYTVFVPLINRIALSLLFVGAVLVSACFVRPTEPTEPPRGQISVPLLWAWAFVPPLALYAAALISGANIFYYKGLIVSAPAFYLLFSQALMLPSRLVVRWALSAAVLFLCVHNYSWYYTMPTKEDWRGAMRHLRHNVGRGNQLIFEGGAKLCFDYYSRKRYAETVPERATAKRVWVVKSLSTKTDEDVFTMLSAEGYTSLQTFHFVGITIYSFRKSAVTEGSKTPQLLP